nr:hypothetical protein [Iningainema tapete BLCC-T55]
TAEGIYKISDGVLSIIADKNTAIPGSNLTFSSFSAPVIESGNVVFGATGSSNSSGSARGIYIQRGETLSVVVDNNTPIPGGGGRNFSDLRIYALDQDKVALIESAFNQNGVYLSHDGTLQLIADRNTPIPGGTSNFSSFGGVALSGERVVFSTEGQGQLGVYQSRDGSLEVVADTNTTILGGVGNFTRFSNPGIDGKKLSSLTLGQDALNNAGSVTFTATFTDGSRGIYRADLITER